MTREEALQWLTNEKWKNANNKYKKEWNEAFDMAIEALSVTNLKSEFESAEYEDYEHATLVDIKEPLKVLVVRCKDCIYYETCNLRSSHWWKGGYTVDIEFCSFGERREP